MKQEMFKQIVANATKLDGPEHALFLDRVANGVSDVFGNVSFKILSRLVNLHLAFASDMEYSKTLSSPMKESTAKRFDFGFLRSSPSTQQKQQQSPGRAFEGKLGQKPPHKDELEDPLVEPIRERTGTKRHSRPQTRPNADSTLQIKSQMQNIIKSKRNRTSM